MLHRIAAEVDWPIAAVIVAYGAMCWLGGWHTSVRQAGQMYDDGFREGYRRGVDAATNAGEEQER